MERLLDAITAVVSLVSPEKIQVLAGRIRNIKDIKSSASISEVVSTTVAKMVIDSLVNAWSATSVSSNELALMLLAASHAFDKVSSYQSTELVWTGPTTPFVSPRRTEQVLLQVINAAERTIFITSFVVYDVSSIVEALNAASDRGVKISMLLELSQEQGGSVTFDMIGKMRKLVPAGRLFVWRERVGSFQYGCVHAKVAVADGSTCFITSANITGYAMEKNMEAGVLISGGHIPRLLDDHLRSLIDVRVISAI
jgi:cardiolipin synthase A/B